MKLISLAVFAIVAAVATAATLSRPSNPLFINFHLKAVHTEEEIEAAFVARTTPDSPLFRQHMSVDEIAKLVGATDATVTAVTLFAKLMGCQHIRVHATRDVVSCVLPSPDTKAAGRFFGVSSQLFAGSRTPFRQPAPRVPSQLAAFVDRVIVMVAPNPASRRATRGLGTQLTFPGEDQNPSKISARYKIPQTKVAVPNGNFSQGVAEFEGSHFSEADMANFSAHYNLPVPVIKVSGQNSGSLDTEGTLDLQYITALAGGVTTWWVSENSGDMQPGNIDFSNWCNQVLGISPAPPSVVSISWGMGDYRYAWSMDVLTVDNQAFRKLGLKGITVLAASGDSGPGARAYLTCSKFMPSWPASSQYLTAVGATFANSAADEEEAVNFSGGGFSDTFATPAYQKAHVEKYLNGTAGLPNATFFNRTGRAYPDVSALGTNFMIYSPGQFTPAHWWPVSGTSCASPTFAAVITRVNAERMAANKPAVGFLNPKIYALGKVGFDVTKGQSTDTDCFGIIPIAGFPAAKGWDAVSGLGTPDYEYLKANL